MKKALSLLIVVAITVCGCSNDASEGATKTDSTINRVDTRRNTTTTQHPLYEDSVSDKFDPPKTGGTPTNPSRSGQ